ncbi:type III pantothenate kinase [Lacrimispora amygdalina]|uniref:Type III pantothenate kinase n=1 Tax=Lacrimispora amygdalina TaxID=253257 RepID=A0A3E2N9R3_9FIRM|nr:type III pantothenate kinase [Clostridium indicum]RFZ77743.1 type III pantothenate kinase [Clostridium indicum]
MILAIDIGNSNIVIGGIDSSKTYFVERVNTNHRKTELEYAVNIKDIMDLNSFSLSSIEGSIVSSVVPPLTEVILSAVRKLTGNTPLLVGSGMKTGLNIKMDNPKTVGSDLIVDAVAALKNFTPPIIVIDMGTATTVSVIDQQGNFTGGIIFPGLRVSLDSLSSRAAQLPYIGLDKPGRIIGKNTIDSMKNGILYGNAAMIDGIIDRMQDEIQMKASLVATGGLASSVISLCRHKIHYDDALLLKGLQILYEKNR